ncbi:hypothetical protein EHF33_05180 [Deinococcus psychrotolerans]|uniref:Uncharacterized protein n=1 Tax=Deinococcus psychrotolerans TaxID=2489213 RepID=A0A3G8YAW9_9DEIO|nr:hypothetical protein [Deinococcus psychrotolerans]AZI42215.1 hypothetical protein EHF33_05180 [Deinococcus psychrotolerans]
MTTLTQLTPLYAAVLLGVAITWLWQVAKSARRSLWPRLGILMPLGLTSLLAAPVLDVPALFGMGAGLVLIAAYWPVLRLRGPPRPAEGGLMWLLLIAGLLSVSWGVQMQSANLLFGAAALTLYSLALLLSATLYPKRFNVIAPNFKVSPTFLRRWQGAVTPAVADLELTLDVNAARLVNTSGHTLHLAGWSPASGNAWLRTRSADGELLSTLSAGETVYLMPWSPMRGGPHEGVRLWYAREGEDATYLFRADWANAWVSQGAAEAGERVLN